MNQSEVNKRRARYDAIALQKLTEQIDAQVWAEVRLHSVSTNCHDGPKPPDGVFPERAQRRQLLAKIKGPRAARWS